MADIVPEILASLPDLVKGIIALFIIVDPFGNVPIFVSLTERMGGEEKKKAFHTATLVSLVLLLFFAIAGREVLNFFGITIYSFMIAGGILLFIIAIRILVSGGWQETAASPESIGAVPIAVPLLVGPGAITTTILTLQQSGVIVTLVAVIINFGIVWGVLHFIDPINKFLGKTGSIVIARIMAMFIAAIAVGYVLEGLMYYFI